MTVSQAHKGRRKQPSRFDLPQRSHTTSLKNQRRVVRNVPSDPPGGEGAQDVAVSHDQYVVRTDVLLRLANRRSVEARADVLDQLIKPLAYILRRPDAK